MFVKYFPLIYNFVKDKKLPVFGIAILLSIAAGVGFFFNKFDGSVELMLPDDINIKRNINFFRDSNFSNKIVISLGLNSKDKSKKDLFLAAGQLAESLTPPLFTETNTGFSSLDIMEEIFFSNYIPQTITEEELTFIDSQINPDSVSKRLSGIYRQLLMP